MKKSHPAPREVSGFFVCHPVFLLSCDKWMICPWCKINLSCMFSHVFYSSSPSFPWLRQQVSIHIEWVDLIPSSTVASTDSFKTWEILYGEKCWKSAAYKSASVYHNVFLFFYLKNECCDTFVRILSENEKKKKRKKKKKKRLPEAETWKIIYKTLLNNLP